VIERIEARLARARADGDDAQIARCNRALDAIFDLDGVRPHSVKPRTPGARSLDPSSPTVAINVRVPTRVRDALDARARREGLTRSQAARAALAAWGSDDAIPRAEVSAWLRAEAAQHPRQWYPSHEDDIRADAATEALEDAADHFGVLDGE
jgi:hypothetical protein